MPAPYLAIDFGTSRTKVAFYDLERREPRLVEIGRENHAIVPSAFYIPLDGQGERLVGDDAQERSETDPEGVVIGLKKEIHRLGKKRIGQGRASVDRVELASDLFSMIRRVCRDEVFHEDVTQCTLTVPVTFVDQQRECIRQAASKGGFREIVVVEEPVAAARAWLMQVGQKFGDHVIVCDVGGGTTDLALLRHAGHTFEQVPDVSTAGIAIGGNDVDESIFELLLGLQESGFDHDAANRQCAGFLIKIRKQRELLHRGHRCESEVMLGSVAMKIPHDVLDQCTSEFVVRVQDETRRFVARCRQAANIAESPVLLVGGASRMRSLKEAIETIAPGHVYLWNQSDYATVLGAVDRPVVTPQLQGHTHTASDRRDAEFRSALRAYEEAFWAALADGVISQDDIVHLKHRQTELGITDEQASSIEYAIIGTRKESKASATPREQRLEPQLQLPTASAGQLRELIADGSADRAFCLAGNSLLVSPDDELFCLWCDAATMIESPDDVLKAARSLASEGLPNVWAACCRAMALEVTGRCDEGLQTLQPFLTDKYKSFYSLWFARWTLLSSQGETRKANHLLGAMLTVNTWRRADRLLPLRAVSQIDLASSEGPALLDMAIASKPHDLKLRFLRCQLAPSNNIRLQADLTAMQRMAPTHWMTRVARTLPLSATQQPASAVDELSAALAHQAVSCNARLASDTYLRRAKLQVDHNAALEDARLSILTDDSAGARLFRGQLFGDLGKWESAYEDFNEALRMAPGNFDASLGRAIALTHLGQFQGALAVGARLLRGNYQSLQARAIATCAQLHVTFDRLGLRNGRLHLWPNIPAEKQANVAAGYGARHVNNEAPLLLLLDDTYWGGAREGFAITPNALFWHNKRSPSYSLAWKDIQSVRVTLFRKIAVNGQKIDRNHAEGPEGLATVIRDVATLHRSAIGLSPPS